MNSTAQEIGYMSMQQQFYDEHAVSLEDARALVHPDFELATKEALSTQAHVLLDYIQRTYPIQPDLEVSDVVRRASSLPPSLRALDFGCGVGRLMEPLVQAGFDVDGVDISARMLEFARQNANLSRSRFFRSNGNDCGGAPDGEYDLAYSRLCFQHLCVRSIRNELLDAFAKALRPGGVVAIQMHFYPDYVAATVPSPHAPWSADAYNATATNSDADVWPTPDELPLVYEDFARNFEDVRFQFVRFPQGQASPREGRAPWVGHLIVSGSTAPALANRLYTP